MGTRNNRSKAPWSFYSDRGIATLNATIAGKRCRPSLGIPYDPATASARDVREIEAAAARAYSELVAGRVLEVGPRARIMTSHTLHELFALWLVEAEKLWPRSYETRISQLGNVETWATEAPRFNDDRRAPIERLMDDAGPAQFAADRLTQVLKGTVGGELSNLYAFFDWAVRERHLATEPPRPKLPRGAQGVRVGPQRAAPVDITLEEALAMCEVMPEWSAHGGGTGERGPNSKIPMRVRDVFRLSWELALRPGIAQKIRVPRHYVHGQSYVWITRDIDKIGLERRLPLTKVAQEILERCAPAEGLIFGEHDLTYQIKRAAKLVLPPEKARQFARYDFRHGRAVHALEVTGDLPGTQRLLGQLQATTTNRYIRTREAHVTRLIAALDADAADAEAEELVRKLSGEDDAAGGRQETPMGSSRKNRGQKKNPEKHHRSPGLSSPHLPRSRNAAFPRDHAGEGRQRTPKNVDESLTDLVAASGSRQEGAPEALTTAMREQAITKVVWDAFDLFQLHELGIELDDVDGGDGSR